MYYTIAMEITATMQILTISFVIALLMGAVSAHTNFCTMGAISDWVNMGSLNRLRAWFLAMGIAIFGVTLLEFADLLDISQSWLPYNSSRFAWPRYLLGGLMFGIGMTLASGCIMRNLIRLGGGNLKSLCVLAVVAICAWAMMHTTLYGNLFAGWINTLTIELKQWQLPDQRIPGLLGIDASQSIAKLLTGLVLATTFLAFCLKSRPFRQHIHAQISGTIIGLGIICGWALTASPIGQLWFEDAQFQAVIPPAVGVQSYSFISPFGDLIVLAGNPSNGHLLTFALAGVLGIFVGSLVYYIASGKFRLEWFPSIKDAMQHLTGAALMGIGGVLSLGCTIGQGLTGISTLSIGSFLTTASIILGAALTMKITLYRMVYTEEAWLTCLTASLVDLRLLPPSLRKLEKIQ